LRNNTPFMERHTFFVSMKHFNHRALDFVAP
jgi:hypothetical protein